MPNKVDNNGPATPCVYSLYNWFGVINLTKKEQNFKVPVTVDIASVTVSHQDKNVITQSYKNSKDITEQCGVKSEVESDGFLMRKIGSFFERVITILFRAKP